MSQKKKKREKEAENIFEDITAENFLNLGKETDIQVQEAQRAPGRINLKKITPRYVVNKMAKTQDKILKEARESNNFHTKLSWAIS